jgi:hypothetical protein
LSVVASTPPRIEGLAGPNIDSEMRFYSVLWVAYGATALWVARALPRRVVQLRLMLVVFMLGGVGRAISHLVVGAPHPLFAALMWAEIILPPALIGLSYAGSKATPAR